jgi:hypothetical protein
MTLLRKATLPIACFFAVLTAGCGDGKMNTTGQVVKGGQPFTVPEDDFVRVSFVPYFDPDGRPKTSYIAAYDNSKGTFRAVGPDLRGIPRGKYIVSVTHERNKKDLFNGAYDLPNRPFVFDIDPSTRDIVIDLDMK